MTCVSNLPSWENVAPIVLFWIIPAEVDKLKSFRHLFSNLQYKQTLEIIWMMTQPKNSLISDSPEIQAVYDCIMCSPQLTRIQTNMHYYGNDFFLWIDYDLTKKAIANFFEEIDKYMTSYEIMNMITLMLQLSSSEFIDELFYHYKDIWDYWVNWDDSNYCLLRSVKKPVTISDSQQRILLTAIYTDSNCIKRKMLSMHDKLVFSIMSYRNDKMNQLEYNIEICIEDLHQMFKDHV